MSKHIVIYEPGIELGEYIKDYVSVSERILGYQCEVGDVARLAVTDKVSNGSVIVCVRSEEHLYDLHAIKEKFPLLKITLVAKKISEDVVKKLQYEEEVIDLFFKAPFDFMQYEFMVTALLSEETKLYTETAMELPLTPEAHEKSIELDTLTETVSLEEVKTSKQEKKTKKSGNKKAKKNSKAKKKGIVTKLRETKDTFIQSLEDFVNDEGELELENGNNDSLEIETQESTHDEFLLLDDDLETQEDEFLDATKLAVKKTKGDDTEIDSELFSDDISSEIKELVQYKDDKFLKIIHRNEALEEENQYLQSKVFKLEEKEKSAKSSLEQKNIDFDQLKIKASILEKRSDKQTNKLVEKIEYLEEKSRILKDQMDDLKSKNKELSKKNVFDHKRVKLKEDALKEKIELIKDDVASQIQNRERRIVNLKRKIDLLEFDLKDSVAREKTYLERISVLEEKLYSLKKAIGASLDDLEYDELEKLKKAM